MGEEGRRQTDDVENEVEAGYLAEVKEMHHRVVGVGELGLRLSVWRGDTLEKILIAIRMPTKNTIARKTITRFFN